MINCVLFKNWVLTGGKKDDRMKTAKEEELMQEEAKTIINMYRVDRYAVSNVSRRREILKNKGQLPVYDKFYEYFLVAGDHSIVRITNFEEGVCKVYVYDHELTCTLPVRVDEEGFQYIDYTDFNKVRKCAMIYDYAVTELRKMGRKEALKSPIFELKRKTESILLLDRYDEVDKLNIPRDVLRKLQKRCDYLAYAYAKEWRGVISLDTVHRFSDIESLKEYIETNDLSTEDGEGEDKRIEKFAIAEVDEEEYDPLIEVRDQENEAMRYYDVEPIVKNDKFVKQLRKDIIKALKLEYKLTLLNRQKEKEVIKNGEDSGRAKRLDRKIGMRYHDYVCQTVYAVNLNDDMKLDKNL